MAIMYIILCSSESVGFVLLLYPLILHINFMQCLDQVCFPKLPKSVDCLNRLCSKGLHVLLLIV